jgi:uncharacterized protein (DUF427 family)
MGFSRLGSVARLLFSCEAISCAHLLQRSIKSSMNREKPGPGQESVWDYPRPPRLEQSSKTIRVVFHGQLIAQSIRACRVLETSHPPTWYIPSADVNMDFLEATSKTSFCEWKGMASYWTVRVADQMAQSAAWSYEAPNPSFASIKSHIAFYPSHFECYVDDERVIAQPGGLYGGWITRELVGPFKGVPGSWGW